MNATLSPQMLEATRLTRAGRLAEATTLLQHLLHGGGMPDPGASEAAPPRGTADGPHSGGRLPRIIDLNPETGEPVEPGPTAGRPQARAAGHADLQGSARGSGGHAMPRTPESLRSLLRGLDEGGPMPRPAARPPEPLPEGAQFLTGSFAAEAGSRDYRLYVPASRRGDGAPAPLVVMLHGCTQSPEDFAAGTRMNALAEEHGLLVLYPAQPSSANAQRCWNWFSPGDQRRGGGEPSIVAGMTRRVVREHGVDPRRVYVAGLSAGGAAAAILGQAYPELYAAVGVHSGLACGAARDLPSAFAAMHGGAPAAPPPPGAGGAARLVPTIVFHADRDTTVHPRNGDQVIAQSGAAAVRVLRTEVERDQVPGGHGYSRTLHRDGEGRVVLEHWLVHGGGHAWSGGSPAGSYTDPRGPDASRAMLRFFLEHAASPAAP
jgi:poly(hydroxyalkanoate) depolymerase family esterase